ncbi:MAG TPA: flagellar motor protein MotD [Hyphomicrobiales bacterium]|nr:flagellar motor protein MotD [Hyphomicrobiales bacterium]
MARKRKAHQEHENHERWLVSYADFITLLFAFFVVMYSISSVNEGKYRVLSDSMVAAFRSTSRTVRPIQVGEPAQASRAAIDSTMNTPRPRNETPVFIENLRSEPFMPIKLQRSIDINENDWALDAAQEQVSALAGEVSEAMRQLLDAGKVEVRANRLWLEVEVRTSFLFPSASAEPSIDAEIILSQLASVLKQHANRLHVEGHTDDQPIQSSLYPSNWELSSARAAAVVRLLAGFGIAPQRMASVGYGEYRPVADNGSELGRALNRRVLIIVLANLQDDAEEASVTQFELLQQRLRQAPGFGMIN